MAVRRPLTRVSGKLKQLPDGDVLSGIPAYIPVTQYGGALLKVTINSSTMTVPIGLYGGGSLSVPVAISG
ncbi:hypothetical protein ACIGCM_03570 [Pseudomonas sp. NPDC078700]|uniref:hypothetical protein n=1 Tax=Pseudomonas sp. NPDC078700 TaxID=3364424 RepID=UPI0037C96371